MDHHLVFLEDHVSSQNIYDFICLIKADLFVQLKDSSHRLAFSLLQAVEASHRQDLEEGDRSRRWGNELTIDPKRLKVYYAEKYDFE